VIAARAFCYFFRCSTLVLILAHLAQQIWQLIPGEYYFFFTRYEKEATKKSVVAIVNIILPVTYWIVEADGHRFAVTICCFGSFRAAFLAPLAIVIHTVPVKVIIICVVLRKEQSNEIIFGAFNWLGNAYQSIANCAVDHFLPKLLGPKFGFAKIGPENFYIFAVWTLKKIRAPEPPNDNPGDRARMRSNYCPWRSHWFLAIFWAEKSASRFSQIFLSIERARGRR
jgi:hypothetical protein